MDDLKLCPFCGGCAFTGKKTYPNGDEIWHIYHMHDGFCFVNECISADFETEEEAIEAWNRRVNDE